MDLEILAIMPGGELRFLFLRDSPPPFSVSNVTEWMSPDKANQVRCVVRKPESRGHPELTGNLPCDGAADHAARNALKIDLAALILPGPRRMAIR